MFDLLAQRNIRRVIQTLVDVRQYPENFVMLNRIPSVNAMDGEIFARFKGRVIAADIISSTGKAPARQTPEVSLEQVNLPVIKHFRPLNRDELNLLNRIESNLAGSDDRAMLIDRIGINTGDLVNGVWMRENQMLYAMLLDSFVYNKNGIIFNTSFGMPSDLKLTLSGTDLWSAASTATPVADIQTVQKTARIKYGVNLNRVTLSQTAFDYMIRTTEFRDMAETIIGMSAITVVFPYENAEAMTNLANRVVGVTFEIDDTMYTEENNDGSLTYHRNLPENKVLLTSSADDGRGDVFDWANAAVEEAMPGMVPAMIGAPEGGPYGPFGYVTAADSQGNPPGVNVWAVARGFPRKHMEAHSAVLTVTA